MATTAPFVKLLRQLSDAKDEYRSGALDLEWEGGKASLFFVFGQPNHATFEETGGAEIEGDKAVTALLDHLPSQFEIKPWRKQIIRNETITMTSDELIEPFTEMAGSRSATVQEREAQNTENTAAEPKTDVIPPLLAVDEFPLLPGGEPLWTSGSAAEVRLSSEMAKVSSGLVTLTAPKLRAAGVIVGGEMTDAIWVDGDQVITGELASMALIGATSGTISGFKVSEDLARLLPGLWHLPTNFSKMNASWINIDKLLSDLVVHGSDQVVVTFASQGGRSVGLIRGELQMSYSESAPDAVEGLASLKAALAAPDCVVTLLGSNFVGQIEPPAPLTSWDGLPEDAAVPEETPAGLQWEALNAAEPEKPVDDAAASAWGFDAAETETPPSENGASPLSEPVPPTDPSAGLEALTWSSSEAEAQPAAVAVDNAESEPANADTPAYEAVKADMVRIAVRWLGDEDAKPIAEMINATSNRVEAFVSTIDRIRNVTVPGQEPSVVKAMARDMHYYAAEALSGV